MRGSALRSRPTVRRFMGVFSGDLSIAVIALGLSMALWVAVTSERNPMTVDYLPAPLPVQLTGLGTDLILLSKPEPVRVRVSGPRDAMQRLQLQPESLLATVDLTDKGAGEHRLEVMVRSPDPAVRVQDVTPLTVVVRLDKQEEKRIPTRAVAKGSPPFGFIARTPEVEPKEVTVSGPLSVVHSAAVAVASVSLDGKKESLDEHVRPEIEDNQGRLVEGIQIEPGSIRVQVRVEEELSYRPLPIRTQISGTVASGYWVEGVTVEPAVVTVVGRRDVLESLTAIDASPVDITGLNDVVVRTVPLIAPQGAGLSSAQTATIRVSIAPVRGTATFMVAPGYQGLAPGRTATASSVQVTLAGPVPVLKSVEPSQLRVTIDVTNVVTGTHSLIPSVVVPDRLTLLGVSPDRLAVEIK